MIFALFDPSPLTLCINCSFFTLAATLRWFTAGGAIRIALRQLSQTWKLRHLWRHNLGSRWKFAKKWLERILVLVRSII